MLIIPLYCRSIANITEADLLAVSSDDDEECKVHFRCTAQPPSDGKRFCGTSEKVTKFTSS
ncbi:MAG: hypothetical protein IKH75_19295 [Ruminococcus sp.]|nr:hypothetical protein [Ruminococcus sp.]HPY85713.1 hypothetical protein [Ruminococcus flavefaciens]